VADFAVVSEATLPTALTPPDPEVGMAAASRPYGRFSGPYGRPWHPLLAMVAIGAWVCSVPFDLLAFKADAAWIYARAAYLLIGGGVVIGIVAGLLGLFDLFTVPRGTRAFRTGTQHLLVMVTTLALFAGSYLLRADSGFVWHDRAPTAALALSAAGLVTLAVGGWLGGRLTYAFGVRVALDEDRLKGFEADT
jgi:uncharacterized membrane protein